MKEIIKWGRGGSAYQRISKISLLYNQGRRSKTLPEMHGISLQGTVWVVTRTQSSHPTQFLFCVCSPEPPFCLHAQESTSELQLPTINECGYL